MIKQIKIPNSLKDADIKNMFDRLSGVSSPDITIIFPKYRKIEALVFRFTSICQIISKFTKEYESDFVNFTNDKFVLSMNYSELIGNTYPQPHIDQKIQDAFHKEYEAYKKSNQVMATIGVCNELAPYKNELSTADFILNSAKSEFKIFPFSKINLKTFLIDSDNSIRKMFASAFEKFHNIGHDVYKILSSPDVDLDELAKILGASLESLEKQPKLNRCKKAFAKLKESIHLLKDNFAEYHKDYLQTGNSTIIMEHFVLDVSKNTKASPELANQFREIVRFYKNLSNKSGAPKDPKISKLYSALTENLDYLDRASGNIKKSERGESFSEDIEKFDDIDIIDMDVEQSSTSKSNR